METIHDVWRLLIAKAGGGRLQDDEAEQALAVIDAHEAAQNAPKVKKKKGGAMSETSPEPAEETVPDPEPEPEPEGEPDGQG